MDGYWSFGDEGDGKFGKNLCFMAMQMIKQNEGYWSSGSKDEDEDVGPNYCYMAPNDTSGRSIIQQVKSMIIENYFDLSIFEPYLT